MSLLLFGRDATKNNLHPASQLSVQCQRVVHTHAQAPVVNQPGVAQHRQVPRDQRLGEAQSGLQFADACRVLQQLPDDPQPRRITQGAEDLMELGHKRYGDMHIRCQR